MRLVQSRTPARFQTEFEKALFAAQVGPSISAALLSNSACYVATPEWEALFRSLAVESNHLTDRSPLTIKIRSIMLLIPGLWQEVDSAVKSDTLFNDSALKSLADRCRKIQRDILEWTEDYKNRCVRLSLAVPSANELAMRRELFGLSLECLVIFKRLLATVSDHEREELEVQAQACSRLLLDLQDQPSSKHSWLFTGHEVGMYRCLSSFDVTLANACICRSRIHRAIHQGTMGRTIQLCLGLREEDCMQDTIYYLE